MVDAALAALLAQHQKYFEVQPDGKVQCLINGHAFPPRLDVIQAFINGSKFAKLKRRWDAEHALDKYEPFIIQSANFPNMLYCALTGQLMDKSLDAVRKHMQGKKFKYKKALFAADKMELKDEPDIDSVLAEITGRKVSIKKGQEAGGEEMDGEEMDGLSSSSADSGSGDSGDEGSSDDDDDDGDDVGEAPRASGCGAPAPAKVASKQQQQQQQQGRSAAKHAGKAKRAASAEVQAAGGEAGQSKGRKRKHGKQAVGGGAAGGDEEGPELWVPPEMAAVEHAMGEPSTSGDEGEPAKPARGRKAGKAAKQAARMPAPDDFVFPEPEDGRPEPAAKGAGSGRKAVNGSQPAAKSKKHNANRPSKAKKARL